MKRIFFLLLVFVQCVYAASASCSSYGFSAETVNQSFTATSTKMDFNVSCIITSQVTSLRFETIDGKPISGSAVLPPDCSIIPSTVKTEINTIEEGTYAAIFSCKNADHNSTLFFTIPKQNPAGLSIPDSNMVSILFALGFVSIILVRKSRR
ncbi:MAG: hypothetical protein NTZ73_03025 [Candidatus Diapherotrites archaeon]|nr:hypothetical protein [Candidatus Diapherotrites archaeon]